MIPIPLRDELPSQRFPAVTVTIIVINVLVWLLQLTHGVEVSVLGYGAIPAWVLHGTNEGVLFRPEVGRFLWHQGVPFPLTVLTSMWLHGGWMHLIGNMWFLWIFGDNVEDAMGRVRYAFFYLVCGVAAALAQIFTSPGSVVPMVGASGAIAGVLGAYALLYPWARVRSLLVLIVFVTFIRIPAWLLLGLWFLAQIIFPSPGVAWMAHVGGFVVGLLLVFLLVRRRLPPRQPQVVAYPGE